MPNQHRALLWTVAGMHLLFAVAAVVAGVAIAVPIALVLVALGAFALGCSESTATPDRGHAQLGHAEGSGYLPETGPSDAEATGSDYRG